MQRRTAGGGFRYYMHDGVTAFSFELAGSLSDGAAQELEQAWRTASSVIGERALIVDLSFLSAMDLSGQRLLSGWRDQGAQFVANSERSRALLHLITGESAPAPSVPTRNSTWLPFQVAALVLSALLFPATAEAANLKPETLGTWDAYVQATTAQMRSRLAQDGQFLVTDETSGHGAKLRNGEILVSPAAPNIPKRITSGLIHHWVGAAFIPDVTLRDVLTVVRDYDRYRQIYHPLVIDSRAVHTSDEEDRFSMLLMNKSIISKTALDSDYRTCYVRVNDQRWYSVSETVRIQEIAGYGTEEQHSLPEDEGTGLIWRVRSIARFEERDGGVYVELEAMVLSRDVPAALRWMLDPIVRRVSRESLRTSLQQTREAVRSAAKIHFTALSLR
jgi:hypothetical protein